MNMKKIDEKYNEKCDIYSLGIIFYCLLFNKMPYKGAKDSQIYKKFPSGKINIEEKDKKRISEI